MAGSSSGIGTRFRHKVKFPTFQSSAGWVFRGVVYTGADLGLFIISTMDICNDVSCTGDVVLPLVPVAHKRLEPRLSRRQYIIDSSIIK